MNVELRNGEIALITRALRTYAHAERMAIQTAKQSGPPAHAADVQRQVLPRLAAINDLIDRLIVAA